MNPPLFRISIASFVCVIAVASCAAQQVEVTDDIAHGAIAVVRHCKLQSIRPTGSGSVQMLCAGSESWVARGRGSNLALTRLYPFARGTGNASTFQRGGTTESVVRLLKLRHIRIDGSEKVVVRDWPATSGSLKAATAGPKGSVQVLLRRGDDCYLHDLRKLEKGGRIVSWASKRCLTEFVGLIPRAGATPDLWLVTRDGVVLGNREAITERLPIAWLDTGVLATTADRGAVAFIVGGKLGVRVIRKMRSGEWIAMSVGGTSAAAESSCPATLSEYFKRSVHTCRSRGHRVKAAAAVSQGASLWLLLATHRYERLFRQRIEGGGPAMRLRSDIVGNRERVQLTLVELRAGKSASSWNVATSEGKDVDFRDPNKASHALDDLVAVRLAVTTDVVHVGAQNSERLLHFTVDLARRRSGDKRVALVREALEESQKIVQRDEDEDRRTVDKAQKRASEEPEEQTSRRSQCAAGSTRCEERCIDLRSDVHNCGTCGRRCLSGRCDRGKCAKTCFRDSDCNNVAMTPGSGYSQVCVIRGRRRGGIERKGPSASCRPGSCRLDETCRAISKTNSRCVPRTCHRDADCKTPGAHCLSPSGRGRRQCLPPGHCSLLSPIPRSAPRGR